MKARLQFLFALVLLICPMMAASQSVEEPVVLRVAYENKTHSRQFQAAHPELSERIWDAIGELREEKLAALADAYLSDEGALIKSISELE
ncbi:MAG: hypothetical protein VX421_12735 [Pseudomonadota bacterium]|nr:hypothetical protein [Pseudomonadota bacterium]